MIYSFKDALANEPLSYVFKTDWYVPVGLDWTIDQDWIDLYANCKLSLSELKGIISDELARDSYFVIRFGHWTEKPDGVVRMMGLKRVLFRTADDRDKTEPGIYVYGKRVSFLKMTTDMLACTRSIRVAFVQIMDMEGVQEDVKLALLRALLLRALVCFALPDVKQMDTRYIGLAGVVERLSLPRVGFLLAAFFAEVLGLDVDAVRVKRGDDVAWIGSASWNQLQVTRLSGPISYLLKGEVSEGAPIHQET